MDVSQIVKFNIFFGCPKQTKKQTNKQTNNPPPKKTQQQQDSHGSY